MRARLGRCVFLAALPAIAAGCALDGKVLYRFDGAGPVVVTESVQPELTPLRAVGRTKRRAQVVRATCAVTLVYDVREATGSAVLIQRYAVSLRTRKLGRGTRYAIDCNGPMILELPKEASMIAATAAPSSGAAIPLIVNAPIASIAIAWGKSLRPEPGTQLVLVESPTAAGGSYGLELTFQVPDARPIREKAITTAVVACGRQRYLQPILPPASRMVAVPPLTLKPSAQPATLDLPRVASGISSQNGTSRVLSCGV